MQQKETHLEDDKYKKELTNWKNIMKSSFSTKKMMIDLVKYPVITEKSYIALYRNRQYTFDVDLRLTKTQIKELFENLFNIHVIGVNTHRPPRKKVRAGMNQGYKTRYKRVILTIKNGESIPFDLFKPLDTDSKN